MNWKLHIFLPWFLEFVVVSCMYMLEPWTSLVPLILMTPLSLLILVLFSKLEKRWKTKVSRKIKKKLENLLEWLPAPLLILFLILLFPILFIVFGDPEEENESE